MGIFSKIKKGIGKVFEPIVKGLDKITGGKFSKFLGKKWVQYALIAVSVVVGGIAIANGIMAAGQAGVGAAAKAFATNMSMETGKTLMSAMVEGGKQFVTGVAKGLLDPMGSDAGKAFTGLFDSGSAANIAGTPVTGADQLNEAAVSGSVGDGSAVQSAIDAGSAPVAKPISIPGGTESVNLSMPSATPVPGVSPESIMQSTAGFDPSTWGGSSGNMFAATDPFSASAAGGGFDPAAWGGSDANLFTGSGSGAGGPVAGGGVEIAGSSGAGSLTPPPAMEPDILTKLGNGVVNYAKSPQGMYQIGTSLQGWANGQALQEQWDRMDDKEKQRYRSWTDGSFKPVSLLNPRAAQPQPAGV